jgi:hypothetical protein
VESGEKNGKEKFVVVMYGGSYVINNNLRSAVESGRFWIVGVPKRLMLPMMVKSLLLSISMWMVLLELEKPS